MRTLSVAFGWGLLLMTAGCQSFPHESGEIVGDSMSLGAAYPQMGVVAEDVDAAMMAGCPSGCAEPGGPDCGDCAMGSYGPPGCAGNYCDGRCGGRCAMAMARLRQHWQQHKANFRPCAHCLQCANQRCAGGVCGGAVGPEFGAVHYPYYTTRGPRDFFLDQPPSIGP